MLQHGEQELGNTPTQGLRSFAFFSRAGPLSSLEDNLVSAESSEKYHEGCARHQSASISSAISSMALTLFQLRAVPVTFSTFSTADHGSLDLPDPFGK